MTGTEHQPKDAPRPRLPLPDDCDACEGAQQLLNAFKRFARKGDDQLAQTSTSKPEPTHTSSSDTKENGVPVAAETDAARIPCPLTSPELGRMGWGLLHTTAAYYPASPTSAQQSLMRAFIDGLGEFYPCRHCAEHLRSQIHESPPDVSSNVALSGWFCYIHNQVNEMLGKPIFDCSRVMERWRTGRKDGSCVESDEIA